MIARQARITRDEAPEEYAMNPFIEHRRRFTSALRAKLKDIVAPREQEAPAVCADNERLRNLLYQVYVHMPRRASTMRAYVEKALGLDPHFYVKPLRKRRRAHQSRLRHVK